MRTNNVTMSVTEANSSVTFAIDYADHNDYPLIDQGRFEYRSCLNCERHPRFPDIPAVTLHKGTQCTMCNGKKRE